jgi:Fe-S-cluster-containing hydrogenase component 2
MKDNPKRCPQITGARPSRVCPVTAITREGKWAPGHRNDKCIDAEMRPLLPMGAFIE